MPTAQLSDFLTSLSGSLGEVVVTTGKRGTVLRKKPTYARPTTPLQKDNEARMKTANLVWSTFTAGEADAWNDYALTITLRSPHNDTRYHPTGYNAFLALALKFLQVNPSAAVPRTPPARKFAPAPLLLTVTPERGALLFTANAPNPPGTVTELLLQTLPNPRRKPTPKYLSKGFVVFTSPVPTAVLDVLPGAYAAAYRLVCPQTGERTEPVTLGKTEVTAAAAARVRKKAA